MSVNLPPPNVTPGAYGPTDVPDDVPPANPGATGPTGSTPGATGSTGSTTAPPLTGADTISGGVVVSPTGQTVTVTTISSSPLPIIVNGQLVDFGSPALPPPAPFSTEEIVFESTGNPFLDTAIQVSVTLLLLSTAKEQALNQLQEALNSRDAMVALFEKAQDIAKLIMEKAETQKEQYMAQALAGFAGLVMAVAGAAISIAGAAKTFKSSGREMEAKSELTRAKSADATKPEAAAGEGPSKGADGLPEDGLSPQEQHLANYQKLKKQGDKDKASADKLTSIGQVFTHGASSTGTILQNSIEATYVTKVAAYDAFKQIAEAVLEQFRHRNQAANEAIEGMKSVIDSLFQLIKSYHDASAQNFTINSR